MIIPARDAEGGVVAAVASALDQPEVAEVIVVDDGSRDQTACLVADLAGRDRRVVCLTPPGAPVGPGAARNAGVAATQGEILAFLDADDVFLPGAFAHALPLLADPGIDIVVSRLETRYVGRAQGPRPAAYDPGPLAAHDWLCILCDGGTGLPVSTALVRRSAFDAVGGFSETLTLGQDLVLWIKLACTSRLAVSPSPQPIAIYWRHGGNRSDVSSGRTVQSGVRAFLEAWRWARSSRVDAQHVTSLLRGAGVRERQLVARALHGDLMAGAWALQNIAREPRLCANRGFWMGASAFRRMAETEPRA